jgi:hypothetical protein
MMQFDEYRHGEDNSVVLGRELPPVLVGVLKEFADQTPDVGDIFAIPDQFRHLLYDEESDASFTVVSVKKGNRGRLHANLAGKTTATSRRSRVKLKLWTISTPGCDTKGHTVVLRKVGVSVRPQNVPFFLVKRSSPEYQNLRPKDYVQKNVAKRDARNHFKVGEILYESHHNGRCIVEKVTACFVKFVGQDRKAKVFYGKNPRTGNVEAHAFSGCTGYYKY